MAIKKSAHPKHLPRLHPGLEQKLREAEEAENAAATVETVAIGDIEVDPGPFVGTKLRSEGAVASMLGTQGFWLATPSGNPFLVAWSEELLAEGAAVSMGDTIAVDL